MNDATQSLARRPFRECYCLKHEITPESFKSHLLAQAIYPHARLLAPLLKTVWPDYFLPDYDLICSTALIRRSRDFPAEIDAFYHHPGNTGLLRRFFRLRISTSRLHREVRSALTPNADSNSSAFQTVEAK